MAFAGNAQVLAEEEEEEEEGTLIEEEVGSESPLQNAEQTVIVVVEEEEEEQGARAERVSASSSTRNDNNGGASPSPSPSSSSRGSAERLTEDSGVFSCTICWEPWTSDGVHRVCSLPCGHLYGRSCIMKWIQQCGRTNGKCPQCKRKLKLRDIRTLYAPRIAVADEDLQKEVISLRSENEFLKLQKASLLEEVDRQKV